MFAVPQVGTDWVVELVNEFSDATRGAADEQEEPYPRLSMAAGHRWTTSDLVAAANELHAIFDMADRGQRVESAINAILDRTRPWPRATRSGIQFAVADVRDVLCAACALPLVEWVANHGRQRMGVCAGDRCVDVFTDASAAGHRRFCSVTCSNRHRVAVFRARRRDRKRGA